MDAAYTSQCCPRCGHTEKANRPDRDQCCCRRCGLAGPADVVAGQRARAGGIRHGQPQDLPSSSSRTRPASR
ncbi:zinc ribbon domain-containing protein [Streptomyces sp. NPDC002659]|uniref:zinc ribbon domain-containing protein n=1 Tax=Streptomyces sp. NPDC002659 TaxID=3364656 RepID=UPI003688F9B2